MSRLTAQELSEHVQSRQRPRGRSLARRDLPNEKLIACREQFGLSQQQVADALHLGRTAVVNLELGYRRPSVERAILLARFYETTVEALFGYLVPDDDEEE